MVIFVTISAAGFPLLNCVPRCGDVSSNNAGEVDLLSERHPSSLKQVSGLAAARGDLDIGVGNVIGSNVANMSLVLGAATFVATIPVKSATLRREAPLSIAAVVVFALVIQGGIHRWEGGSGLRPRKLSEANEMWLRPGLVTNPIIASSPLPVTKNSSSSEINSARRWLAVGPLAASPIIGSTRASAGAIATLKVTENGPASPGRRFDTSLRRR